MAPHAMSSRSRLGRLSTRHFVGNRFFDRLGRAVCEAAALPRKEFSETWEVATRIRKKIRGRPVLELGAGHGFLSMLLLLLDDSIPRATCVDRSQPLSHDRLLSTLTAHWPRLAGRVEYRRQKLQQAMPEPRSLVACVHGCGELTDIALSLAITTASAVAVLPCCHDFDRSDTAGLSGWLDVPLAIDVTRAARLAASGYVVRTATIPVEITPRNRLLLGWPREGTHP
ncbi:MAG: methyltransferase [Planctomycetota bacterium]